MRTVFALADAPERLTNIPPSEKVVPVCKARSEGVTRKPLEQRVADLKDITTDIPNRMNKRLEAIVLDEHEAIDRIAPLDRQVFGLMRGGVTPQRVAQDKAFAEIKLDVAAIKAEVGRLNAECGGIGESVARLEIGLTEILPRVPKS